MAGTRTAKPEAPQALALGARLRLRLRVLTSPFRRPETQFLAVTLLILLLVTILAPQVLVQIAARSFLPLGSIFSLASLGTALGGAILWVVWRRPARARRLSWRLLRWALFPRWLVRNGSNTADIGFLVLNHLVSGVLLGWALISHGAVNHWTQATLASLFGTPGYSLDPFAGKVLLTVAIFLAYEFANWLDHYLAHKVPFLWEFHRVHHTAEVLTPLTIARVHPIAGVIYYNITAITVGLVRGGVCFAIGLPDDSFVLGGANILAVVYLLTISHFQHTHFWIPFTGIWGKIFVSPAHHQIHHSQDPAHFGRNFGNALSLFDWLFGTLLMPSKTRPNLVFGVGDEAEYPHSFTAGIFVPFARSGAAFAGLFRTPPRVQTSEIALGSD